MIGYFARGTERLPFFDVILEQPCKRLTPLSGTPTAMERDFKCLKRIFALAHEGS